MDEFSSDPSKCNDMRDTSRSLPDITMIFYAKLRSPEAFRYGRVSLMLCRTSNMPHTTSLQQSVDKSPNPVNTPWRNLDRPAPSCGCSQPAGNGTSRRHDLSCLSIHARPDLHTKQMDSIPSRLTMAVRCTERNASVNDHDKKHPSRQATRRDRDHRMYSAIHASPHSTGIVYR